MPARDKAHAIRLARERSVSQPLHEDMPMILEDRVIPLQDE